MRNKILYIGLLVLGIVALFYSCEQYEWFPPPNIPDKNFTVKEAKTFFQNNRITLKPLDLGHESGCCADSTHHHAATKSDADKRTLTPEWNRAIQVTTAKTVVLNIPFKENVNMLAITGDWHLISAFLACTGIIWIKIVYPRIVCFTIFI